MPIFSLLRKHAGLSVVEAAGLLNLSVEIVAEYERGTRIPAAGEIRMLASHTRIERSSDDSAEANNGPVDSIQHGMQRKMTRNSAFSLTSRKLNGHDVALGAEMIEVGNFHILEAQDVFAAFDWVENRRLQPTVTMLDPWYNKGVGGVISDNEYDCFIVALLERACAISRHVYLWGFPEILGPFVRRLPKSHRLVAWLTWYYKNNPSVIRGWRSAQMACLHISEPDAPLYPQHFLNAAQKKKLVDGKLRYMPGPASVIESPLNIGFVGRKEQTGHPAQKPLSVYDKLLRMVTVEGDLIFDPMCGAGTSGVVAKIRNRRAILNDINPDYVEIARQQLAKDLHGLDRKLDLQINNRESSGAPPVSLPKRSAISAVTPPEPFRTA